MRHPIPPAYKERGGGGISHYQGIPQRILTTLNFCKLIGKLLTIKGKLSEVR